MSPYNSNTRVLKRLNDNTVMISYYSDILVDTDDVRTDYKLYDLFTKKNRVKKLVVFGHETDFSIEARLLIQKEDVLRKDRIIAEALVAPTLAQQVLADAFINQVGNLFEMKKFNDVETAQQWLALKQDIPVL